MAFCSPIFLVTDYGQFIELDECLYERVGPEMGKLVSHTVDGSDHTNVGEYVWYFDVDNVQGGDNHRTWQAPEHAVSYIEANNGSVALDGTTPVTLYTAPSKGELRIWQPGNAYPLVIAVDGVDVLDTTGEPFLGWVNKANALALRVAASAVVTVRAKVAATHTVLCTFSPDVYTPS